MQSIPQYEFTFLRHGESVGNAGRFYQGQHDFELTERGQQQAQALAERWRAEQRHFDAVISSPLKRAAVTAETVAAAVALPVAYDDLLLERHNGKLAGLHHDDPRIPQITAAHTLFQRVGETGESQWQLYLRAGQALTHLMQRPPGRYLVVSHGGLLNMLYHVILGMTPQANGQGAGFSFGNTAFGCFTYNPASDRWRVICINDSQHLSQLEQEQPYHQSIPGGKPDTPYRFTLLRHAQSTGNAQGRFQGQAEYPLSAQGQAQAEALLAYWHSRGVRYDQVLSSPQQRAHQTAKILADGLSLPLQTDPLLKEVDNGGMAGLDQQQMAAQYPQRSDHASRFNAIGETGESWWAFNMRVGIVLHSLVDRGPGNYLVVSHGAFFNYLLFNMLNMHAVPGRVPLFHLENSGYAQVTYSPRDNFWQMVRSGVASHLDAAA